MPPAAWNGGCSSFTPQARLVLGPLYGYQDLALNNGVLNDGGANIPVWDPNERVNLFVKADHKISDNVRFVTKASYTNRQSRTMGAPESLCLDAGCGNRIAENMVIDADQIYNPFGVDLSVADGTLEFFARRPLESGGRIFDQDINTYFITTGLEGQFETENHTYNWDITG